MCMRLFALQKFSIRSSEKIYSLLEKVLKNIFSIKKSSEKVLKRSFKIGGQPLIFLYIKKEVETRKTFSSKE